MIFAPNKFYCMMLSVRTFFLFAEGLVHFWLISLLCFQWRGMLQSSGISIREALKHDLNSPEWQCLHSTVLHLMCAHIHTYTLSFRRRNSVIQQGSLRDESIVWVEISSHHLAPNEGGLPRALWMTLKGFVREDLTLLLQIMCTKITGKKVCCSQLVYLMCVSIT